MRLIDADKIIITRPDYVGALTLPERLRRLLNIQPTVKAIPIERINNWLNTGRNAKYFIPMMELIKEWEKENETN